MQAHVGESTGHRVVNVFFDIGPEELLKKNSFEFPWRSCDVIIMESMVVAGCI